MGFPWCSQASPGVRHQLRWAQQLHLREDGELGHCPGRGSWGPRPCRWVQTPGSWSPCYPRCRRGPSCQLSASLGPASLISDPTAPVSIEERPAPPAPRTYCGHEGRSPRDSPSLPSWLVRALPLPCPWSRISRSPQEPLSSCAHPLLKQAHVTPIAAPSLWHARIHMPTGPRPKDGEMPTGLGTRFQEVIHFLLEAERISQEHGS